MLKKQSRPNSLRVTILHCRQSSPRPQMLWSRCHQKSKRIAVSFVRTLNPFSKIYVSWSKKKLLLVFYPPHGTNGFQRLLKSSLNAQLLMQLIEMVLVHLVHAGMSHLSLFLLARLAVNLVSGDWFVLFLFVTTLERKICLRWEVFKTKISPC